MYSVDLKSIVPKRGLTCHFSKATSDESKLWHRRLCHLNIKTMNKLVKGNLVRGLPSKLFENDETCVACQKRKQHRASYDYSRFTWVFFLATKDETSGILKSFITGIENLVDHKVKVIRCDNRTKFKNREMNQFCEMKGILRQYSIARTPQQNGVAEAVNTACYVQNRALVVKPHNKTPYELFHGRTPTLSFMRPFGCPVTTLNTIDHLGKFNGKADEGFFVGYSLNSKAFRVFNSRTMIVEENLHIRFNEITPNVVGRGPDWLFDIDALTRKMNYEPVCRYTGLIVLQVQKQVIMHGGGHARNGDRTCQRLHFATIYGLLIPPFPKIKKSIMMKDQTHVMMEKKVMNIQEKDSRINDQEQEDNGYQTLKKC
ncbi:putative ribonuclease H-like domain-containing protein [Tanacetum coccineum]